MEYNKKLGLIGMLVGIGSAVMCLVVFVWLVIFHESLTWEVFKTMTIVLSTINIILAVCGLVLSSWGYIKGSSKFAIIGIIVSAFIIVFYIIIWTCGGIVF